MAFMLGFIIKSGCVFRLFIRIGTHLLINAKWFVVFLCFFFLRKIENVIRRCEVDFYYTHFYMIRWWRKEITRDGRRQRTTKWIMFLGWILTHKTHSFVAGSSLLPRYAVWVLGTAINKLNSPQQYATRDASTPREPENEKRQTQYTTQKPINGCIHLRIICVFATLVRFRWYSLFNIFFRFWIGLIKFFTSKNQTGLIYRSVFFLILFSYFFFQVFVPVKKWIVVLYKK